MATTRPFAYNTGTTINGTTQVGNLAVGVSNQDYSTNPGGVKWWMGPDEDLGYVIAKGISNNTQPTPLSGVQASVGFERSSQLTDPSFISLANTITNQGFTGATQASTWLTANGYWNSYSSTPSIITSGLSLHLDAGDPASYPGTGTTWTSLVNGYTGTMGTGVGYSSSNGGVITFNGGVSAYVNMYSSASALAAITNNISVEAWYQSTNNQPGILRTGISSSGFVFGYFSGTGTAWKVTKYGVIDLSTGVIPQNTSWHHVVLTYSSTTGTRIYIDGALSGTALGNTTNIRAGNEFSIGRSESIRHNGNIAIFRWYSSVLSASDVLQNFNATKSRFGL